jgi:peptidoglycan-associated lipoprotein
MFIIRIAAKRWPEAGIKAASAIFIRRRRTMKIKMEKLALLAFVMIAVGLAASCAQPTAKLRVSRNEVQKGDPVTVSWETKNAKTIELNGEKVQAIGAKTVTPNQTTNFEVIAKRGKKDARDRAIVTVNTVTAPAPNITLRAEPSAVEPGQNATLRWSTQNAKSVTISELGEVPSSGERTVSPRASTTYTGTATGDGGTATASARVTVTEPSAPVTTPTDTRPRGNPQPADPAISEQFTRAIAAIFFEYDKADLLPAEQEKLRRAAEWLQQDRHRTITFRIEGNCDPRGTAEYNLGLGDRRARAAKNFLVNLGVDPNRIETVSYGLEKAMGREEGSPRIVPSWAHDRRDDFIYLRGGER